MHSSVALLFEEKLVYHAMVRCAPWVSSMLSLQAELELAARTRAERELHEAAANMAEPEQRDVAPFVHQGLCKMGDLARYAA